MFMFINSSVSLLISTFTLVYFISLNGYLIDCLSLTELHSSLPSNNNANNYNRYKLRLLQEKSIRDAVRNLNHQQHGGSSKDQHYSLNHRYPPTISSSLADKSYSLPDEFKANLNYLISPKTPFNEIDKRQDEVVMDIPLEYTSDIPYEIYPDPGFLNQYPSLQGKIDDLSPSDVYEQILAAKIANLLEKDQSQHGQALLQYIPSADRKKRVLVKRNNRSGISRSHKKSNRVSTSQSTKPSVKAETQPKSVPETGHHPATIREHKLTKIPPKKLGETKQEKLNRKELSLMSRAPLHRQAVKGDSDRSNHTLTKINHSKVISKSESNINNGKHSFAKNLRKTEMLRIPSVNLNRKEKSKVGINKQQLSMKEFFNDVDLPKGPKNIVKRSIVSPSVESGNLGFRRDDDIVDGYNVFANDDDMDTGADSGESDKEEDFEGEINDEYRPIGQASASSMVVQANPWLADEATRTLMRSLSVKRRKRGFTADQMALLGLDDSELLNNNDDDDNNNNNNNNSDSNKKFIKTYNEDNINERLSEPDEISKTDTQDFDEAPTRIVKKDGATLEPFTIIDNLKESKNIDNKGTDKKRSGYGEKLEMNSNSNKGLSKGQQKSINGLEEGESDDAGTNDTFFEEEFAEGLISIGDLSDLNPLNDTASTNSPDNMKKRDETPENRSQNPPSTSSTSPPNQLANADEERLDSKLDELIVNGSSDHDGELLETTIDESKRIYVNKKKRSVTPYFGRVDESLITQEEAKFTDVDDKLEKIEEALIWEALDLIKSNLDSESGDIGGKNVKNRIESRLNAAYDLEDMRISLTDLHKTMQKMSTEDDEADDNNTHNNEVDQETIFDKDDGIIFSDNIEDNGKEIGIIGHQLNQPSTPYLSDNHHDQMKPKDYSSNPDDSDDCKAIQLLTSDCSAVKDIVPSGPLEKIFVRACNWHEVCYSCGELFGLLSSDCDMGFLEQSRLACNDSSSCETASRLILMPLRQRRTFYKRKVSPMCYQQPCIENFLLKSR